jgi:CRISPR system Cascade subunit CasB
MDNEKEKKTGRPEKFVEFVIALCQRDKGAAAALRRADNPATEYQSWEYLAGFNIDLENRFERIPYAAIAAAIARAKAERNGAAGIGKAIALCYPEKSESAPAQARFRRLLACDSVGEACRILRPLFSLIDSKAAVTLDYAKLLDQLIWFHHNSNNVKTAWATDFYRHAAKTENEEVEA